MLRARGVEVVEFDFLTPELVADYCYDRGFLQVWAGAISGDRDNLGAADCSCRGVG